MDPPILLVRKLPVHFAIHQGETLQFFFALDLQPPPEMGECVLCHWYF